MTEMISHPYTQALAWALVHFLWQGAAIGLASYAVLRVLRTSRARYAAGVAAMALLLVAPVVTFTILARQETTTSASIGLRDLRVESELAGASSLASPSSPSSSARPSRPFSPAVLFAVLSVWLIGVVVLSIRLAGGWMVARRIAKRHVRPATAEIQALARRVAGRLALERIVSIFESSAVSVPVMIGWIKPAVLLPVAALSGLSTRQIEALLAHELAHVQRHDYLVNLLQSAVETLLFYHPAVWWISRQVRSEREHCCDDLAVGVCDRVVYVTALADLASMSASPRLALAATDGSLARRVRRILGRGTNDTRESTSPWLPMLLAGLMVAVLIPVVAARAGSAGADRPGVSVDLATVDPGEAPIPSDVPRALSALVDIDEQERARIERQITEEQRLRMMQQIEELQAQLTELRRALAEATGREVTESRAVDVRRALAAADAAMANAKHKVESETALALDRAKAALSSERMHAGNEINAAQHAREIELRKHVDEQLKHAEEARKHAQVETKKHLDQIVRDVQRAVESRQVHTKQALEEARVQLDRLRELEAKGLVSKIELAEKLKQSGVEELHANLNRLRELEAKGLVSKNELIEAEKKQSAANEKLKQAADRLKQSGAAEKLKHESAQALDRLKVEESARMRETAARNLMNPRESARRMSPEGASMRDRVLREGANLSDNTIISMLKDLNKLEGDSNRAEVLIAVARVRQLTPEMVSLYLSVAESIRTESERERVLDQPIRIKPRGRD